MDKKQEKEPEYLNIQVKDLIESLRVKNSELEYKNTLLSIQIKQAVNKINELTKDKKD